ncbi:MAG: hypothetical protein DRH17_01145 [Deltaproteobacteria bacterium]|nr:MAG: hypothetical protein DRH17_01145 [Deltaproteobacteria bacterium]
MEVNPTKNLAIVPFTKNSTYLAKPYQRTAIPGDRYETTSEKNPENQGSRRLPRDIASEKGTLVDIYV